MANSGDVDTGGEPWLANISAILRKKFEMTLKFPNVIFRGLGEDDSCKKTWTKKSRDTVPLRTHLWMMFCKFLSWASQKALPWKRTVLQYILKLFNKTGENVAQGVYLEKMKKKLIIYSSNIYKLPYRDYSILYIHRVPEYLYLCRNWFLPPPPPLASLS